MFKTKHSRKDIDHEANIFLSRSVAQARRRRPGRCGELEGLVYGESREMNIVFGAILNVATEMLVDLFRREGIVMDCALDVVELCPLICEGLEECGAAGTRSAKDD